MLNKSLSLLGNVINALVEYSDGKTKYVPFRDSKLTFFLKDSLEEEVEKGKGGGQ